MDCHTRIGFNYVSSLGYCKKCKHIFRYGWNSCRPLSEDSSCPKCKSRKNVETENFIETRIQMLRGLTHSNIINDEQKKYLRKDISDLNEIRRKFDEFEEEERKKRNEEFEKRMKFK